MKAESGHIVFKDKFKWKDLADSFEEMLKVFLDDGLIGLFRTWIKEGMG